jgi:orotidine-5'-phosphate decarboxylase
VQPKTPAERLLVALDTDDIDRAVALAEDLAGAVGGVKLGKEFFTAHGPAGVERVMASGCKVFLDLKFHDIPNTVVGAVRAAVRLAPFMLNVHASGGPEMMRSAMAAAHAEVGSARPIMLAVTVLTSLADDDLAAMGVSDGAGAQVQRLAALAATCAMDGVVCSPREVARLRQDHGPHFVLLVPGVRPDWAASGDQKRTATPAETVAAGADYLVIGRPITRADNPADAVKRIADEIAEGTS